MTRLSSLELLHPRVLQTMLDELPIEHHNLSVINWLKLMLHRYKQKELTDE